MNFLSNLHYYFIAMRKAPFARIPCPHCEADKPLPFLRTDRYLLPVEFSVCTGCGFVYTSRNMVGASLQQFYAKDYRRYYENASRISNHYLFTHKHRVNAGYRMLRIRERVPHFSRVLEIGSGLGYFLEEARHAGATQLLGLELGDTFRQYAQQKLGLKDAVQPTPFETLSALPFAPDLVVMFHVFEHLEDPAGCLRWLAQHMDANGTLVIEVPDIDGDWEEALGLGQFHTAHRWYFSAATLSNMLAKNGFVPTFITRDDGDGIYPGNLRIFANPGVAGAAYPLPVPSPEAHAAAIAAKIKPWSLRQGWPRAALRLVKQALRG